MIKVICDKCGKEIMSDIKEYFIPIIQTYHAEAQGRVLAKYDVIEDSTIHLCDSCKIAVAKFIGGEKQ